MSQLSSLETAPVLSPSVSPANDQLSPKPFPSAPPGFVIKAVIGLRKKLLDMANGLIPPEVRIFEMSIGAAITQLIGGAARLGIADLLADGPRTAEELAAQTGTNADVLHRSLRALALLGVFTLGDDGRFQNNRFSSAMRSGMASRIREYAIYFASGSNLRAWNEYPQTLRTGQNGFERAHGMSVWSWFEQHPDERETFAQLMMGLTIADAPAVSALYPFKEVKRICDVGGGRGALLSEILIRHPHLQGILCDGPGVIASARELLARRGVAERVQLIPGSFFDQVPGGADAYVLKNILHDWDDARALKILGVVRRAMERDQRLLIVETLTERNDTQSFGVLSDVHMMMVCSDGRERSRADFERLLGESGFALRRVFPSPTVSVVEGVAV